jgi:hypothetical protein
MQASNPYGSQPVYESALRTAKRMEERRWAKRRSLLLARTRIALKRLERALEMPGHRSIETIHEEVVSLLSGHLR